MILPHIRISLPDHEGREFQLVFLEQFLDDLFIGAREGYYPDLALHIPDILKHVLGLGLVDGEDVFIRIHLLYNIGKGLDGHIVVLGRNRESLLITVPGQIPVFKDLILTHCLLRVGNELPSRIRKGDTFIGPLEYEEAQFILKLRYAG